MVSVCPLSIAIMLQPNDKPHHIVCCKVRNITGCVLRIMRRWRSVSPLSSSSLSPIFFFLPLLHVLQKVLSDLQNHRQRLGGVLFRVPLSRLSEVRPLPLSLPLSLPSPLLPTTVHSPFSLTANSGTKVIGIALRFGACAYESLS